MSKSCCINTFICGRRGTGKTHLLYSLIESITSPDSFIFLFSPTLAVDETKAAFLKRLKKRVKNPRFEEHFSIFEGKGNHLIEIKQRMQDILADPYITETPKAAKGPTDRLTEIFAKKAPTPPRRIPIFRERPYPFAKFVLIFDDLAQKELQDPTLFDLVR